jgi:hypothetical protein
MEMETIGKTPQQGEGEGATPKSPMVRLIAELPDLGMFGITIWLLELPTRTPDGWFIQPITGWRPESGEMPPQPKFIPLNKVLIEWKKKFGEPGCYVLIKWGASGFVLKRYEEINPHYIAGISLREALLEGYIG